jgi:hypothetical protein
MSKKIVFKINKDGNVSIDNVEGYGSACLDTTKMLERALGRADESTRRMTDEYEDPIINETSEHIEH